MEDLGFLPGDGFPASRVAAGGMGSIGSRKALVDGESERPPPLVVVVMRVTWAELVAFGGRVRAVGLVGVEVGSSPSGKLMERGGAGSVCDRGFGGRAGSASADGDVMTPLVTELPSGRGAMELGVSARGG